LSRGASDQSGDGIRDAIGAVTVPGAGTQFQDPDEQRLFSTKQAEDGVSLQMGTNSVGLQTAPSIDSSNLADNRALIPSP
jgi:hypothetical protein